MHYAYVTGQFALLQLSFIGFLLCLVKNVSGDLVFYF